MSDSEKPPLPGDYFPQSVGTEKYAKKLGGYDIYKNKRNTLWNAIVAVENPTTKRRSVKFYRWTMMPNGWRVGDSNFAIDYFDFDEIKRKVEILKEIYKIN